MDDYRVVFEHNNQYPGKSKVWIPLLHRSCVMLINIDLQFIFCFQGNSIIIFCKILNVELALWTPCFSLMNLREIGIFKPEIIMKLQLEF